jgi:hypothetical protein
MFTVASFMNMTRHKHLKLDQSKIDRAKKLLGAKAEQDTIEQALDLVLGSASSPSCRAPPASPSGARRRAPWLRP